MRKLLLILILSTSTGARGAAWYEDWSARPAWPEPVSFTAGTGLTLTTLAFRKPLIDDLQADQSRRKPLGEWSKLGDISGQLVPNALYAGGMIIASYYDFERAAPRAQLMIMTTAEAALITTVLKYTIRQERPDSSSRTSFPSGHSTTAFSFASVVGIEHGWKWGIPAYTLATFVAWSRINDNRHYLHDVLAGATIGISTGLGIHYARERRANGATANYLLIPAPLEDGGAIYLTAVF